jgi:hypothetical protein
LKPKESLKLQDLNQRPQKWSVLDLNNWKLRELKKRLALLKNLDLRRKKSHKISKKKRLALSKRDWQRSLELKPKKLRDLDSKSLKMKKLQKRLELQKNFDLKKKCASKSY